MSQSPLPRIGFIGIGAMGWPMAACLVKAGYTVIPHDARSGHTQAFLAQVGGEAAQSLADLGRRSDVVITILPTSAVVEQVLFGADGVAQGLGAGARVIDMTSGIPAATQAFAERLAGQGVTMFDAPVSGGVARARTGDLTIMAGGETADVDAAMPILRIMGSVIRTGKTGSGHAMKALNNLVSAGGFLIGIEALLIGAKFGIAPQTMVDILNVSTGVNNSTQKKFKQFVLSRSFDSGFAMELMVKDLSIALEVAREGGVTAPFASLCREMWAGASHLLGPGADHTAVAQLSERLAGYQLADEP
ncbi:MAG: NAD(P)-dependent oxidoreductase [Pseudomonadota bacterium]